MKKTNVKKDIELVEGLYKLGIEIQKLQEELRSDPPSNPQIEKNLQILRMLYPIWAGTLFSSGKRPKMRRALLPPVGHAVMSPPDGRNRWLPGWKPPKKHGWMFSPKIHATRLWKTGRELNPYAALHFFPEPNPGLIHRADEIPSKKKHYRRNRFMSDLPQSPEMAADFGWDDSVDAACHQFLSSDRTNTKFVSPDGHSEVVFDHDGHIVTASEDYGTYNFVDSRKDPLGHFYQDVLPWLLWGNDEEDTTDMRQRLRALVVYEDSKTPLSRVVMEPAGEGADQTGSGVNV